MIIGLLLLPIFASNIASAGDFTGFAKISSNYIWRGITFSENQPTIGLNANYTFDSGLYGNIYGTNSKFSDDTIFEGTSTKEMDLTAGYFYSFENLSLNFYYNRYEYLDQPKASSNEIAFQFKYSSFTFDYAFHPNWFGYNSSSHYVRFSHKHSFNNKYNLVASIGRDIQEKTYRQQINGKWKGVGFTSYFDYALSFQIQDENNFMYEFQYSNTDRKLISYNTGDDGKKTKAKDEALTASLVKSF